MVGILVSVAISAIFAAGLLYVVRQRLGRQFADIERRLLEVERTASAIKQQLERSTAAAELQRLHQGMVRLHESIALRYGPLLPLADAAPRRCLSELQHAGLEQWAAALDAPCDRERIDALLAAVAESDLPVETADMLARIIALPGWNGREAAVGLAVVSAGPTSELLRRAAAKVFERMTFFPISSGMTSHLPPLDALIVDESFAVGVALTGVVKPGGVLVGPAGAEFPQFDLIATAWSTSAHRKREES